MAFSGTKKGYNVAVEIKTLKTLLIINPNSGTLRKRRMIPRLTALLESHFPALDILYTQKGGDASEFAREALLKGVELILCAGGDGTINEVAARICGTSAILGIIPTGTGNGLAREIGLHPNPMKAVRQLIGGKPLPVYPARVNDHKFLLVSGAGVDAFIASLTDRGFPRLKKMTGFFSYLIVGFFYGWKYPFHPINAQIDGRDTLCYGLLVLKAGARVGPLTLAPPLSLKDPQLAVFVFKRKGFLFVVLFFLAFLFRLHLKLSFCPFMVCKEITAQGDRPVPVQYDGETGASLPVSWKRSDKPVYLIYPA
jgi:diacylglycerol kinase family enzyme